MSSEIISIRHGEPKNYTSKKTPENNLDLTDVGIEQVKKVAKDLYERLLIFDEVITICSPAVRAEGTAEVFISEFNRLSEHNQKLNRLKLNYNAANSMRPMDIKDLTKYLNYMESNSTDIYGELWLTGNEHSVDNDFVESRDKVDARANRVLRHYTRFLNLRSLNNKRKVCIILFNHFEIGTNFLKGLYTESANFPISQKNLLADGSEITHLNAEAQKFAEPIIIKPVLAENINTEHSDGIYEITAPNRGLTKTVKLITSENRFKSIY